MKASAYETGVVKRSAFLVTVISSFLTPFTVSSVNVALPAIGGEFAMDAVLLSWVPTSFLLAAAMFLVPFGRIADISGRNRVFTAGIVIHTASSLLLAFSPSAFYLIFFRVLQGFGSAMIFGTVLAIVTSVFPPGERGRVLGITVAVVYLGLSMGPLIGGLLTYYFGWRSIFFVTAFLGAVVIAAVLLRLPGEWAEARGERFDWIGSAMYSLSLTAFMFGLSQLPASSGWQMVIVGVVGTALFFLWEARFDAPLLPVRLFRENVVFIFSNLSAFVNYSATFAVSFLLSLYLQYIKGLDPRHAGMVIVAQPAVMVLFSPFSGRLSDRIEPRIVASAGMGLTALGLFLFTFLDADTSLTFVTACLVIVGAGFGLFSSPNTNAVMSSVEKKSYGVASAVLGTMRLTGQMMSMGIAMVIFSFFIGKARITPELHPSFLASVRTAFIVFAVLCTVGIFMSLARGKIR